MRISHAVIFVALLGAPFGGSAQTLSGRVLDVHTRQPLSGVELTLLQDERVIGTTVSDSTGRFQMTAPGRGRFKLSGARLGYTNKLSDYLEFKSDEAVSTELLMSSTTVKVKPVEVNATRNAYLEVHGFYERQAARVGDFMTGEQIQRRNAQSLADLLRGLRGLKIQRVNFTSEIYFSGANCFPSIIVDGQTMRWGGKSLGVSQPLDDLVRVEHIEGIEAYRGGSGAPTEFVGPNAACGVVLIWTRHR